MERYETIVIASPLVTDEDMNQVISNLEHVIADGGGNVIRVDRWGKRRMAYRIKKFEEGHYALIFYEASGDLIREVERRIRIDDRLIRFMTVHVDWEEKLARAEAERAARPPRGRYGEDRSGRY
ncbi:MAG: 30S ribosomal protein S6, partial [Vicinamibacteria bacterium]